MRTSQYSRRRSSPQSLRSAPGRWFADSPCQPFQCVGKANTELIVCQETLSASAPCLDVDDLPDLSIVRVAPSSMKPISVGQRHLTRVEVMLQRALRCALRERDRQKPCPSRFVRRRKSHKVKSNPTWRHHQSAGGTHTKPTMQHSE